MPPQRLTSSEVPHYLDQRSEWAILTTIDADGYPHSVPLGYYRIGEDVYLGTRARTHKVRNIEQRPRGAVLVAGSKAGGDWRGVLIQGDISIISDPSQRLEIEREGRRQRGVPENKLPTAPRPNEVILKLTPFRTTTWSFG